MSPHSLSLWALVVSVLVTSGPLLASRLLGPSSPSTAFLNPLVLQKYSLTPSASVVGTNAATVVAPTEQLLSYVPAPSVLGSPDPSTASLGSISPLPIMNAFKSLPQPAGLASLAGDIPVTYK